MKVLYTTIIALILTFAIQGQTIHDIEAGGGPGGPSPYYSPQFITIQVGDIVRWTNSGGTHNVDGTMATFPDNPEGFTNGAADDDLWVFLHTFTIPGFYEFECSAFDHSDTQFGSITVEASPDGVEEYDHIAIEIFPNPSSAVLNVNLEEDMLEANIYSMDLKLIKSVEVSGLEKQVVLDLATFSQGAYFLEVRTESGKAFRRFVKD